MLSTVTAPDGAQTSYGYQYALEPDQTPPDYSTPKRHLDVSSITDPNGQTYSFTYGFDQTRYVYTNTYGAYVQTGLPRLVQTVSLPGIGRGVTFSSDSKIAFDDNGLTPDSHRSTTVTDTEGHSRTYTFGNGGVYKVNSLAALLDSSYSYNEPAIIYYRQMFIAYADGGSETFHFDLDAGLALSSASGLDGTTTTYAHADPMVAADYRAIIPSADLNGNYDDPTSQTNALGGTKIFTYNDKRLMASVIDEIGRKTVYTFDSVTQQQRTREDIYATASATSPVQTTLFEYGDSSHPGFLTKKTVKDLGGTADLVTQYVPDVDGHVAQEIVNPDGLNLTTSYSYDANGNKLTAVDPNGHTTRFAYDVRNRLITTTYQDGSAKNLYYDARGNKVAEYDENGHATLYQYDGVNRVVKQARDMDGDGQIDAGDLITRYEYNAVDSRISITDPNGNTTLFGYDGFQRLIQTTDPLGHSTSYTYGENSGGSVFDGSQFKPTSITDPRGYVTGVAYDPLHRPLSKSVQYQKSPSLVSITTTEYDDVGNPVGVTDPLGHTTTTTYDVLNRPLVVTYPDGNHADTLYSSTGLKLAVTEYDVNSLHPTSHATDMQYDGAGRSRFVLAPFVDDGHGNTARPRTETIYDAVGNVAAIINPLGNRWDFGYDARNRKVAELQPAVADGLGSVAVRPSIGTVYDAAGNGITKTDARGNATAVIYDAANRPVTVVQPVVPLLNGGIAQPMVHTAYDLNGNVLTVTDSNGHLTSNTYDALNRLLSTQDGALDTVQYNYDEIGNKTAVVDGNGHATNFTYDGLNRLLSQVDATGHAVTLGYDALNKTGRVDALGQVTRYGYDVRNRLAGIVYEGRTQDNRDYAYDGFDNLLTVVQPNFGSSIADVAYVYDALNRVTAETSADTTHHYTYDLVGNCLSIVHGGTNTTLINVYDALNRLSILHENGRTTVYAHDLNGNIVRKTLPNGDEQVICYDALNRAQTVQSKNGGDVLENYAEIYDPVGDLVQTVETYQDISRNRTISNTYDGANRLLQEAQRGAVIQTTTYGYDAANNRISQTVGSAVTTYTVNSLNQLTALSGAETASYGYDLNGNRSTATQGSQTDVYGYDYENRLVALGKNTSGGGGTYAYAYDYRTRRVLRTEGSSATHVSFSGGTSACEFITTAGMPDVEFIRGSDWGGGVGGILYSLRGGGATFNHYNNRGDVVAKTDASGNLTYQAEYSAFGARPLENGTDADRQRANTKEEDPTGLLNEGFRYRDLATGTFIARDPAGFVDGPNLYAYVADNPWTHFDPEGLSDADSNKPTVLDAALNALYPKREKAQSSLNIEEKLKGSAAIAKEKAIAGNPMGYEVSKALQAADNGAAIDMDAVHQEVDASMRATFFRARAEVEINEWKFDLAAIFLPIRFEKEALQSISKDMDRIVLSGHGIYDPADGFLRMPEGTSLTVWAKHGRPISNELGNAIEANEQIDFQRFSAQQKGYNIERAKTYLPGSKVRNYTLDWMNLDTKGNPIMVYRPTKLNELLSPNLGNIQWASCLVKQK